MAKFKGTDLYQIDDLLSDEERLTRAMVREFVNEEFLPIIREHYREGEFPADLIPKIAELGLLGANLEGYGCAGLNNVAYGLINQELERGDSGLRSFVSVQGNLVMYPIHAFGSEEQKKIWLPKLANGEAVGCFGLTESDAGSNPGAMRTRAERTNDAWVLNGGKMWITNGTLADVAVVWARTDEGVRGFLVETGTPGFTAKAIHGKLSLRASDTAELLFDNCEIPEDNLLPKTSGLKNALMCLTQARYGIAWGAIGAAMACYEEVLNYAKDRIQFDDKPIAAHQLVQQKLVDMVTEITKGQLLNLQLGRLKDENKATHVHISLAKRNNVSQALQIARNARQLLGANGILDDYHSMRHMCNLETVITYEGTHEIHTLIVGEHITGHPAYS
ncbi:acyl-CoA dehydrogenase [candidate division KSB1 bacterium]|nr:acyl-CoA dehydrogenase [candidate division KSB1 bacterium]NIR71368.1 acyl-CoA dehydrogenase [candidate division KSB1 bacterium]NIS26258.1 acyl-CoA dehydrogenase [candidate division KSB1 bacterium]NIT73009.1 acyl-CoA dehydrogenase [candidate division KSB1 bacterium]NIU26906.1 acyl-CoA dehydrogenase [candidate division KSB1 bacterium]